MTGSNIILSSETDLMDYKERMIVMKRLICILLVVVMAMTLCFSAFADEAEKAEDSQNTATPAVADSSETKNTESGDKTKEESENKEAGSEEENKESNAEKNDSETKNEETNKEENPEKTETNTNIKTGPFTDVDYSAGSWYGQAVVYVYEKGYMKGTGKTSFEPKGQVTRAEVATILYAMAGNPITVSNKFNDVNRGDWYFKPVNWAADMGIVAGYGNKKFGPKDKVTRQQLVTMLYRYAIYHGYLKGNEETAMGLAGYPDVESVAVWAYQPFAWAVAKGLIAGNEKGYLNPQGNATRAEMAVILKAFDANIVGKR